MKPYKGLTVDKDCSFKLIFLYASQVKTSIVLLLSTSIVLTSKPVILVKTTIRLFPFSSHISSLSSFLNSTLYFSLCRSFFEALDDITPQCELASLCLTAPTHHLCLLLHEWFLIPFFFLEVQSLRALALLRTSPTYEQNQFTFLDSFFYGFLQREAILGLMSRIIMKSALVSKIFPFADTSHRGQLGKDT